MVCHVNDIFAHLKDMSELQLRREMRAAMLPEVLSECGLSLRPERKKRTRFP